SVSGTRGLQFVFRRLTQWLPQTALFKSGPGGEGRGGMRNSGAAADRGCGGSGDRW
ncbi:unnamed protein product, partial [Musa acuminata subsp. burmannicoides]